MENKLIPNCPKCGNPHICQTAMYQKATAYKILFLLSLMAMIFSFAFLASDFIEASAEAIQDAPVISDTITNEGTIITLKPKSNTQLLIPIVLGLFTITFGILQYVTEREIIIKYVCPKCGHVWTRK